VPYLLLGVLMLATGLGIGLGLSEAPSASTSFTIFIPTPSGSGETGFAVRVGTVCHVTRHDSAGTLFVCTRPG
jgi:hypothetical protein